jgi:hypothetical protein
MMLLILLPFCGKGNDTAYLREYKEGKTEVYIVFTAIPAHRYSTE